jgi:peptide/nickel transport system substrate-binding protein
LIRIIEQLIQKEEKLKDRRDHQIEEQLREAHFQLPGVYRKLKEGRVSRREFIRTATLLGVSVGAATIAAQCGAPAAAPAPAQEAAPVQEEAMEEPAAATGGIKRGGTLRVGTQVPAVDHPARFSWVYDANQFRHVFEYLTETDNQNITHPYLLESWEANDDLTMWTLKLNQGIKWTNGDDFVADHVVYNFSEWLNPDTGSSILGLWEGFLTLDGVEVVDDYTINLNLAAPLLAVPENLFHYPAQIMHPSFDGDITSGKNPSTGPYTLAEYKVGERVRVVSRVANGDDGYWQMGADDKPLPYLDAIEWIDLGDDQTAAVAAIQTGQIHTIYDPRVDTFLALRDSDKVVVEAVGSAATRVLRFRVDQEPWTDVRVRNAVKMVQDREKILDQAYFGEGILGMDTHASPVQPEFAPMDVPVFDPEGAKALLEEAASDGILASADGLSFAISVGTGWTDIVAYAEALQDDAKAAGINITLDTMPNAAYWDLWTETAVGITTWAHRPLAVMVLPLAYIADSEGTPVPWNESRWVDEEFSTLLQQAQGTLDIEARRAIMADVQRIQQERGSIGVAFFQNFWAISNPAYVGITAHPTQYNLWREVWYDPDLDPFA